MTAKIEGMDRLEHTLSQLIHAVEPAGRRKLGLKLGQLLRRSNTARIGKNVAPDGTLFEPRRRPAPPQFKHPTGASYISRMLHYENWLKQVERSKKTLNRKLRKKMFSKLRTAKHIRIDRSENEVTLRFRSGDARLARVHHFGLRDKVAKGLRHKYPARPLLGFSTEDREAIEDTLLRYLSEAVK